jgi:GH25 family lysozyme M1 (1,4-beta-N-acetylmuramidase)
MSVRTEHLRAGGILGDVGTSYPMGVLNGVQLERHRGVAKHIVGARAATGTYILGIDVSHWQGAINFKAVKAAGFTFVVLKATEGTAYVDVNFKTYRAQAHAAGLIVLFYHYAGSSSAKVVYDATAEANWFIKTVGPLAVGEGVALDWEPINPPANPPVWAKTWLDKVKTLGASPWIYMNSSTEARYNWSNISGDYGLWFAKYDNDTDMDPAVHWPNLTAEQYWDKAIVPGISGGVDVDVFYSSAANLLKFCKGGAPTPIQEDDMAAVPQDEWNKVRDVVLSPGFYAVMQQLTSEGATWADPWSSGNKSLAGWSVFDGSGRRVSPLDLIRETHRQENVAYPVDPDRPVDPTQADNQFGHVLSARAEVEKLKTGVTNVTNAPVDPVDLAAALAGNDLFITKLADALVKRQA